MGRRACCGGPCPLPLSRDINAEAPGAATGPSRKCSPALTSQPAEGGLVLYYGFFQVSLSFQLFKICFFPELLFDLISVHWTPPWSLSMISILSCTSRTLCARFTLISSDSLPVSSTRSASDFGKRRENHTNWRVVFRACLGCPDHGTH